MLALVEAGTESRGRSAHRLEINGSKEPLRCFEFGGDVYLGAKRLLAGARQAVGRWPADGQIPV
jgi:hypothetical protein